MDPTMLEMASTLNSACDQLFLFPRINKIMYIPYKSNTILPFLLPSKKNTIGGIIASHAKEKYWFCVK